MSRPRAQYAQLPQWNYQKIDAKILKYTNIPRVPDYAITGEASTTEAPAASDPAEPTAAANTSAKAEPEIIPAAEEPVVAAEEIKGDEPATTEQAAEPAKDITVVESSAEEPIVSVVTETDAATEPEPEKAVENVAVDAGEPASSVNSAAPESAAESEQVVSEEPAAVDQIETAEEVTEPPPPVPEVPVVEPADEHTGETKEEATEPTPVGATPAASDPPADTDPVATTEEPTPATEEAKSVHFPEGLEDPVSKGKITRNKKGKKVVTKPSKPTPKSAPPTKEPEKPKKVEKVEKSKKEIKATAKKDKKDAKSSKNSKKKGKASETAAEPEATVEEAKANESGLAEDVATTTEDTPAAVEAASASEGNVPTAIEEVTSSTHDEPAASGEQTASEEDISTTSEAIIRASIDETPVASQDVSALEGDKPTASEDISASKDTTPAANEDRLAVSEDALSAGETVTVSTDRSPAAEDATLTQTQDEIPAIEDAISTQTQDAPAIQNEAVMPNADEASVAAEAEAETTTPIPDTAKKIENDAQETHPPVEISQPVEKANESAEEAPVIQSEVIDASEEPNSTVENVSEPSTITEHEKTSASNNDSTDEAVLITQDQPVAPSVNIPAETNAIKNDDAAPATKDAEPTPSSQDDSTAAAVSTTAEIKPPDPVEDTNSTSQQPTVPDIDSMPTPSIETTEPTEPGSTSETMADEAIVASTAAIATAALIESALKTGPSAQISSEASADSIGSNKGGMTTSTTSEQTSTSDSAQEASKESDMTNESGSNLPEATEIQDVPVDAAKAETTPDVDIALPTPVVASADSPQVAEQAESALAVGQEPTAVQDSTPEQAIEPETTATSIQESTGSEAEIKNEPESIAVPIPEAGDAEKNTAEISAAHAPHSIEEIKAQESTPAVSDVDHPTDQTGQSTTEVVWIGEEQLHNDSENLASNADDKSIDTTGKAEEVVDSAKKSDHGAADPPMMVIESEKKDDIVLEQATDTTPENIEVAADIIENVNDDTIQTTAESTAEEPSNDTAEGVAALASTPQSTQEPETANLAAVDENVKSNVLVELDGTMEAEGDVDQSAVRSNEIIPVSERVDETTEAVQEIETSKTIEPVGSAAQTDEPTQDADDSISTESIPALPESTEPMVTTADIEPSTGPNDEASTKAAAAPEVDSDTAVTPTPINSSDDTTVAEDTEQSLSEPTDVEADSGSTAKIATEAVSSRDHESTVVEVAESVEQTPNDMPTDNQETPVVNIDSTGVAPEKSADEPREDGSEPQTVTATVSNDGTHTATEPEPTTVVIEMKVANPKQTEVDSANGLEVQDLSLDPEPSNDIGTEPVSLPATTEAESANPTEPVTNGDSTSNVLRSTNQDPDSKESQSESAAVTAATPAVKTEIDEVIPASSDTVEAKDQETTSKDVHAIEVPPINSDPITELPPPAGIDPTNRFSIAAVCDDRADEIGMSDFETVQEAAETSPSPVQETAEEAAPATIQADTDKIQEDWEVVAAPVVEKANVEPPVTASQMETVVKSPVQSINQTDTTAGESVAQSKDQTDTTAVESPIKERHIDPEPVLVPKDKDHERKRHRRRSDAAKDSKTHRPHSTRNLEEVVRSSKGKETAANPVRHTAERRSSHRHSEVPHRHKHVASAESGYHSSTKSKDTVKREELESELDARPREEHHRPSDKRRSSHRNSTYEPQLRRSKTDRPELKSHHVSSRHVDEHKHLPPVVPDFESARNFDESVLPESPPVDRELKKDGGKEDRRHHAEGLLASKPSIRRARTDSVAITAGKGQDRSSKETDLKVAHARRKEKALRDSANADAARRRARHEARNKEREQDRAESEEADRARGKRREERKKREANVDTALVSDDGGAAAETEAESPLQDLPQPSSRPERHHHRRRRESGNFSQGSAEKDKDLERANRRLARASGKDSKNKEREIVSSKEKTKKEPVKGAVGFFKKIFGGG